VVIYLDDVPIYSKQRDSHPKHLKKISERCRKYDIYLNPKKSIVFSEGKLLGHIISKDGISVNLELTQDIMEIRPPHNKMSMQSLFGKINFIRRFVPNFTKTIKPIQQKIKKDV
jgi:putative transposase